MNPWKWQLRFYTRLNLQLDALTNFSVFFTIRKVILNAQMWAFWNVSILGCENIRLIGRCVVVGTISFDFIVVKPIEIDSADQI